MIRPIGEVGNSKITLGFEPYGKEYILVQLNAEENSGGGESSIESLTSRLTQMDIKKTLVEESRMLRFTKSSKNSEFAKLADAMLDQYGKQEEIHRNIFALFLCKKLFYLPRTGTSFSFTNSYSLDDFVQKTIGHGQDVKSKVSNEEDNKNVQAIRKYLSTGADFKKNQDKITISIHLVAPNKRYDFSLGPGADGSLEPKKYVTKKGKHYFLEVANLQKPKSTSETLDYRFRYQTELLAPWDDILHFIQKQKYDPIKNLFTEKSSSSGLRVDNIRVKKKMKWIGQNVVVNIIEISNGHREQQGVEIKVCPAKKKFHELLAQKNRDGLVEMLEQVMEFADNLLSQVYCE